MRFGKRRSLSIQSRARLGPPAPAKSKAKIIDFCPMKSSMLAPALENFWSTPLFTATITAPYSNQSSKI